MDRKPGRTSTVGERRRKGYCCARRRRIGRRRLCQRQVGEELVRQRGSVNDEDLAVAGLEGQKTRTAINQAARSAGIVGHHKSPQGRQGRSIERSEERRVGKKYRA